MSICDVPGISAVCDVIGPTTAAIVSAPFDWLGQAAANTAQWLFETVWTAIDVTTLVDVTTPGYVRVYNILFGIGVFVMLVFFFLQLGTGVIRRDPGALKHGLIGLARAVLGSFLVVGLTATLLQVTDQLTIGLVNASGNTMTTLGDKMSVLILGLGAITLASPGVSVILMIFLAFLAIAAAAIVWFSLLIRKALLLAAVAVAPLAMSGTVWEHTKGWMGKWASFVIALIVSKLIIVVIFLVGTAQVAAPIDLDIAAISDPLSGIVLMAVAGFAPHMCYKIIAFMGFDVYHAMSVEQEAKQATNRPIPIPSFPQKQDGARKILDGGGSTGGGASTAPSTPQPSAVPVMAGGAPGAAGASGTAGSAGAGGAAGGSTAAAGAGAAGAVPVAGGVMLGAKAIGAAVTAGPKAGAAIGKRADADTSAAQASTTAGQTADASAATSATPTPTAPTTPVPPTPQSAPERPSSSRKG